ncbi:ATP-dependent DNA helicase DDX11 [Camellia sinensis]|nr:ATP-dependent DNA helicase DDX11 [Camellia sinensis]
MEESQLEDTNQKMEEQSELKFPAFPFKPYSIQIDFMNSLYQSLDRGGISMLESPTGTGKTLSIICSALQWLIDRKQNQNPESNAHSNQNRTSGSDDEPDWMRNFIANKDNQVDQEKTTNKKKKKQGIMSMKLDKRRDGEIFGEDEDVCKVKEKIDGEDEFLVEDYESEEEGGVGSGQCKRKASGVSISSSSEDEGEEDDGFDDEDEARLKIYFCSRTHSQLSQFVKELRKTVLASQLKVVCLGSRKNLCINEEVLKLGNSTRISERCLELQKNIKDDVSKMKNLGGGGRIRRTKVSSGCPMLRKYKLQTQFRSEIYQEGALDIEDLVLLGSRIGTCPYYGSRSVVPAADLVVLPYQSLLSKSSRESLGLNLKNNIVIIDEAHNLADSLVSMYNSKITWSQLERVHSQLGRYFERFHNLLGPGNRRYIQTLMVLTRAFLQILHPENSTSYTDSCPDADGFSGAKSANDCSMAINEFLFSLNIDNINLVKLVRYIKESNIIHKVSGYGDKAANLCNSSKLTDGDESNEGSSLSGFQALVDMLFSLTNNHGDGKIIISTRPACSGQEGGYLKYVMLTGEKIFSEIVDQAHAIILAGGTLQPIEETRERLFPWLKPDQLHFFSCSHIVPPESILPIVVSCGPSRQSFDFSYSSRSSPIMIEELGLLLCNLVTVVPEGIVVFFSSFDYEGQVYDAWKASGILARITKKKHVFREPRRNTDVEVVLKEYKNAIDALSGEDLKADPAPHNGAVLLAVVGGKISEGINFSDGMGRCIVMVGLPYPSPSDIELIERVKHIEALGDTNPSNNTPEFYECCYNGDAKAGFGILRSCKRRGKEYYENLCMKAVNQSIGRAIRHINDYAAILLVDARYAADSSKRNFSHPSNKLPQWIKGRLVSKTNNYGEVHRLLHQFFKFNKKRGVQ